MRGRVRRTTVPLLCLVLGIASGAGSNAQETAAPVSRPQIPEPLARLAWLLGDWNCSLASVTGDANRTAHNHVTLAASGDAFQIATTLEGSDKTASDVFGYDPARRQWYERSLVPGAMSQELSADAGALTQNSLTLLGLLRFGDNFLRIRSTYTWSGADAYRFEGAALTTSGGWQTLEVHECKRSAPA